MDGQRKFAIVHHHLAFYHAGRTLFQGSQHKAFLLWANQPAPKTKFCVRNVAPEESPPPAKTIAADSPADARVAQITLSSSSSTW